MFNRRLKVSSTKLGEQGIPSQVFVADDASLPLRLADESAFSDSTKYTRLQNWKLLLGRSRADLESEASKNPELARVLRAKPIDQVALEFFARCLPRIVGDVSGAPRPQFIVGIPPSTTSDSQQWRATYKRRLDKAFESAGFPRPKYWPEPFAVFQYHLNRGDFADTGAHQNVLIVDVGGGTTNVCLIQTTRHGRLARGGINHIPHGVKSIEVGGSTLDTRLLETVWPQHESAELSGALSTIKTAKEALARTITSRGIWNDAQQLSIAHLDLTLPEGGSANLRLTGPILKSCFESGIWPAISEAIQESLDDVLGNQLANPVSKIDVVVFAGGTCQMGLLSQLFKNRFGVRTEFAECTYVISPDYRKAVAHGLAIEAGANSRHHSMMPTRVSAYLQENLKFTCGHQRDGLAIPRDLKTKCKIPSDLPNGIVLLAPLEIGPLVGSSLVWRFKLGQKSKELFFQFSKAAGDREEVLLNSWERIGRKEESTPGRQLFLNIKVSEDGFASISFETVSSEDNHQRVSHPVDPIDLHDLTALKGDAFFGLDFGTDSTECAFVNVTDSAHLEALPSQYQWKPQIQQVVASLEQRARAVIAVRSSPGLAIKRLNEESIVEYVYHSNRIEGSALNRGETKRVLSKISDTRLSSAGVLRATIERLGVMDQRGEIQPIHRIVADRMAAANLRDAFHYVEEIANDSEIRFTGFYLKQLHALVMKGDEAACPGRFRTHPVTISQTTFVPPDFTQVEPLIEAMFERFAQPQFMALPSLIQATEAHARFVSIHPFGDGNGRVARLLANYFLWRNKLPGLLLPWENRERYYDALEECNSKEPGSWGDLTDLVRLFADVFEDTITHLEAFDSTGDAQTTSVVIEPNEGDTNVSRLIRKLSASRSALTFDEQYEDWKNTFSGLMAELKESADQLSRVFRNEWGGSIDIRDYPIIDRDTYFSIRRRGSFSRSWYVKNILTLPSSREELIFYFAPNSRAAREIDETLAFTCSMHISRFDQEFSRHIGIINNEWSRVGELTHDGSSLGVILRDTLTSPFVHARDSRVDTANWYGTLIEDVLAKFTEVKLY